MADYWKSQPRKFCDACKCWIADNKASIGFHENGKKHQFNVEKRLNEIRARGTAMDKTARREERWLEQMEKAAMKDYKSKDLGHGGDISARVFNEEKVARDKEKEKRAIEEAAAAAKEKLEQEQQEKLAHEARMSAAAERNVGGIQIPGTSSSLRKIEAPKTGTKWHKDVPSSSSTITSTTTEASDEAKKWFEAVTEDGQHTYYWHVETHESTWTAPPEGFLSIKEQEKINAKHEEREMKKIDLMYESQAIHGSTKLQKEGPMQGPSQRPSPYGAWKTVKSIPAVISSGPVDLQTPQGRFVPVPSIPLSNDRKIKFKERVAPSLGGTSFGQEGFKKRKLNDHRKNMRKRTDDDD